MRWGVQECGRGVDTMDVFMEAGEGEQKGTEATV